MLERDIRYQRLLFVDYLALPIRRIEPGKAAIDPDPGVRDITGGMQFLTNMRPVNITQVVAFVEVEQQSSIANRQISRHITPSFLLRRRAASSYAASSSGNCCG